MPEQVYTHRERPSLGANSKSLTFSHAEGGVFLGESLLKAYVIRLFMNRRIFSLLIPPVRLIYIRTLVI